MIFTGSDDEIPDFVGTRDHLLGHLVTFARALRAAGVEVPANAGIDGAQALVAVGFDNKARAQAALRAAFVSRKEDLATFDRMFPQFWDHLIEGPDDESETTSSDPEGGLSSLEGTADSAEEPSEFSPDEQAERSGESVRSSISAENQTEAALDAEETTTAVYSPTGRSEPVSLSTDVFRGGVEMDMAIGQLTDALAGLRGRRWTQSGDERIDSRRALRQSFGTGGTVLSLPGRERRVSAVRSVLLVDVSQSVLDTIDRGFLIQFLRRVSARWRSVRVFFFDTSVREVTDAFTQRSASAAVQALKEAEAEWGGGTRIGHAITSVREDFPTAIDRDSIVFVISDGLEVGEIDVLEDGMTWLSRTAATVLWLNPLAASPEYEPTCRGMTVAFPYIDGLFAFSQPADVSEIARQLTQHGTTGNIGYQHDQRRVARENV